MITHGYIEGWIDRVGVKKMEGLIGGMTMIDMYLNDE